MKMKKKLFIPLIAALLTIGLTSVGFAAWAIVGSTTEKAEDATFTAYEVTDQTINFSASFTDGSVSFGSNGKKPTGTDYAWLVADDTTEDLNATLTITITNWSKVKTRTITFTVNTPVMKTPVAGIENYVDFPAVQTITITPSGNSWTVTGLAESQYTISADSAVLRVPLAFTWDATTFGGMNPFTYYNGFNPETTTTIKATAEAALTEVYKLNAQKFDVTVTGKTQ